jgi:hypothetical protein
MEACRLMGNKFIEFDFDMGRQEFIQKMLVYGRTDEGASDTAIKHDREYFARHYNINLSAYINEKNKFIIPYEMADLYCLMTDAMKHSPTYKRKESPLSLQNIIRHNEGIIKSLDNLPLQLADYIKATPEYYNSVYLINYMPVVMERMAALLYRILDTSDIPIMQILEYLIDGLDDVYERFFWEKSRKESLLSWLSANEDFLKYLTISNSAVSTSKPYHLLDYMLAKLFKVLDRSNWTEDTKSTVMALLEKWEEKYKGEKDKDEKIKNEYLCWLCTNKWHELHKSIAKSISISPDDLIEKSLKKYSDRYNKCATIHPHFLGNDESTDSKNMNSDFVEPFLSEISQIKSSLQNTIDTYLLRELSSYCNDIKEFNEVFQMPIMKHLSEEIFLFISELLKGDSTEAIPALLSLYLKSTYALLERFDDKYKRYGLWEYADKAVKGTKSIDECCNEIYMNIYVKIQSQKCEKFNNAKKEYTRLKNDIDSIAGKVYTGIIKKKIPIDHRNRKL